MNNLLKSFDFGNEAGDDMTKEEIESCFVELPSCSKFLNINKNFSKKRHWKISFNPIFFLVFESN